MLRLARTDAVIARAPRVAGTLPSRAAGVLRSPFRGYDALLIPRCRSVHTWFLRGALDLLFVDEQGGVRRVVERAGPWRFFFGPREARAVIELPAGTLCGIGVVNGDRVDGLPPVE
ncbi:MAG: DUF192 domain-containing protein [Verrucomicrobiae bacterium]|nr:DUF192 domain-containing protein [Verrucomicrobiae bacterium]